MVSRSDIPHLAAGIRDAGGTSRPGQHRRMGDDPPSPWPPKRNRIGSGSSLRNVGDAARDRGSGEVGRNRFARPPESHPLLSRDRSVETPQTRYETFRRPRGRRGVSAAAMLLRSSPASSVVLFEARSNVSFTAQPNVHYKMGTRIAQAYPSSEPGRSARRANFDREGVLLSRTPCAGSGFLEGHLRSAVRGVCRPTGLSVCGGPGSRAGVEPGFALPPLPWYYEAMAIAQSKLTAPSQISVPVEVRRRLGLSPGSVLEWEEHGDEVVVRRAGRYTSEDLHRSLFPTPPKPLTLEEMKEGIEEYVKSRHARR